MKKFYSQSLTSKQVFLVTGGLLFIGGLGYGTYFSYTTYQKLQLTQSELQTAIQTSTDAMTTLQDSYKKLKEENDITVSFLTDQQKQNLELEKEKEKNAEEIDTLHKLTTLDPELLKKYSKVFFLSENYNPPQLVDVPTEYKINPTKDLQILEDVSPFLNSLFKAADRDGVNLRVISAYRSFQTQMQLKSNYTVTYGSGANQFSADQGYSEHQLGTTLDFGTSEVQGAYMSFEKTSAFTWLQANAFKYGFILSYPKGNLYYQYEPWHWRFVGKALADDLHDDKKSFYELDQRTIDTYLLKIFD
jgi:LAS superfamily LD-carboxypeptidase LdcB